MKSSVRWALFEYKGRELVILSKPFKTKELADKARLKYPELRVRKIGIGMVRVPIEWPELVAVSRPDDEYPCRLFGLRGKK